VRMVEAGCEPDKLAEMETRSSMPVWRRCSTSWLIGGNGVF
jgi:hypothetical protein